MTDVLGFVFEYRSLLARRDQLRLTTHGSVDRMQALDRLLSEPVVDDGRRTYARCDLRLPAMLRVGDDFEPAEVLNVSGGGVCLGGAPELRPGDESQLRVMSPDTGRIYEAEVEVRWIDDDAGERSMGLAFLGSVRELRIAGGTPRPESR